MAGFGGEDPVGLAAVGDEHGGHSRRIGRSTWRVEDGNSEEGGGILGVGEGEGDESRWVYGLERGFVQRHCLVSGFRSFEFRLMFF